nr:uncharacterized protein LOC109151877 [Ipomoea batatas]
MPGGKAIVSRNRQLKFTKLWLAKDEQGNWLKGFTYGIGDCPAETAEAWALLRAPVVKRDGHGHLGEDGHGRLEQGWQPRLWPRPSLDMEDGQTWSFQIENGNGCQSYSSRPQT